MGFLTESWLLGDSPTVKGTIYMLTTLTAAVFLAVGIGFMGPQTWAKPTFLDGIGLSLLLLIVFWHIWLVLGVAIDLALLARSFGYDKMLAKPRFCRF